MGIFDKLRGPSPEDFERVAALAGYALASAVARLEAGIEFEAVAVADGPDQRFSGSAAEVQAWLKRCADAGRHSARCTHTKKSEQPALRVEPIGERVKLSVVARYFPRTAPGGFELDEDFEVALEGAGEDEQGAVIEGLSNGMVRIGDDATPGVEAQLDAYSQTFIEQSQARLRELERVLPEADPKGRFDFDQDTGQLVIKDASGRVRVRARYQVIGTYSTASSSWFWGWANDSIDRELCDAVLDVRQWGCRHRLEPFCEARVPCSSDDALRLFACSLKLTKAKGWYRSAINETATIYTALFDVEVTPAATA